MQIYKFSLPFLQLKRFSYN